MRLIYSFGIRCFGWAMRLASPFHPKAKRMVAGRKNWRRHLEAATVGWENTIWFHCASLGEFEQGRSLIEAIRAKHPHRKFLLSFFSPSGYEIRKHYAQADHVCYLPLDTPANAADFLRIAKPSMAVFVKYDLWLNLLRACDQNRIPVVLVSALVDAQSNFLKSALRGEYRKAFAAMHWVFTQDQNSKDLLAAFCGSDRISVAGDTRFDRAAQLPDSFVPIVGIAEFIKGRTCIVAGSPWPKDEEILLPCIEKMRSKDVCWIIAPHEIHAGHIQEKIAASKGYMAKYSCLQEAGEGADVLWIDNVGMLSRLYHYAAVAYIGGGFGSGIHNTQEPAVYGCPVAFGPTYDKFKEAVDMVRDGGAKVVRSPEELEQTLRGWLDDPLALENLRAQNRAYMQGQAGATAKIMGFLESDGLV